jgi:hypothetical protein
MVPMTAQKLFRQQFDTRSLLLGCIIKYVELYTNAGKKISSYSPFDLFVEGILFQHWAAANDLPQDVALEYWEKGLVNTNSLLPMTTLLGRALDHDNDRNA